jgi:hypothetical protein
MTGAGCGLKGSWKRSSGEDANYGDAEDVKDFGNWRWLKMWKM